MNAIRVVVVLDVDVYGPVSDAVVHIATFEVSGVGAGVEFYDGSALIVEHYLLVNLNLLRLET